MKGITLSNGHVLKYVVASGALAFDGKGWIWERWLVWRGKIKPELFAVVLKTLTFASVKGNFVWWNPITWFPFWNPWSCFRLIKGGGINKVSLTNKGFDWRWRKIRPGINFKKYHIIVSIYGTIDELVCMAEKLDNIDIVAIEINPSCPNTGHAMPTAMEVILAGKAVRKVSRHPVIVKVSVAQDYLAVAYGLRGIAEAIVLNSVPWEVAFPEKRSPLWRLQKKVGGGGGGVSGKPAQKFNWFTAKELENQGALPVIWPSVMDEEDVKFVQGFGAQAVSFGMIHFLTPWKPTKIVEKEMKGEKHEENT